QHTGRVLSNGLGQVCLVHRGDGHVGIAELRLHILTVHGVLDAENDVAIRGCHGQNLTQGTASRRAGVILLMAQATSWCPPLPRRCPSSTYPASRRARPRPPAS